MKNKLIASIISLGFIFTPALSFAQTPISVPVGGMILMTHECTCSGGWMMYILDQYTGMTLPIVFQFGISRLNGNYNIYKPGVKVLGTYVTGGTCVMASTSCYGGPIPVGTITPYPLAGIGTSTI